MAIIHSIPLVFLFSSLVTLTSAQCPPVHVFGARETTVPPGYGTAGSVVNSVLSSVSGATAEAINYPACGGQASCGSVSYAQSVIDGVNAVASQVNSFNAQCPNTVLVLIGYSQGGQIFDDAFCGGGDTNEGLSSTAIPISSAAQQKIAAAIFMGDPRHIPGLSYNVGTCQASGFAPRPAGFQCPYASRIKSYCDSTDPYCCNGSNAATHQGYANEYGSQALSFILSQLASFSGGGSGTTPSSPVSTTSTASGATQTKYGQCGGTGWNGPTVCASGSTCQAASQWYSQCL